MPQKWIFFSNIIRSDCKNTVFCMLEPSLINQNEFSFQVTNAVFLQSLHIILNKNICFDASLNVSSGRKQYPCNYYIQYFKTKKYSCNAKFIREGPNMQKTVFLQSLRIIFEKKIHFWGITTFAFPALITSKQTSLGFITTYMKYYCCHHCICHRKTSYEKTR